MQMKRSLSSRELCSMASDLPVSVNEGATDDVVRCTDSVSNDTHCFPPHKTACDGKEFSTRKKRCKVVTPELLPVDINFPEIAPLDPLDVLPPAVDLPSSRRRRTTAIKFDSNLFDTGPATAALNAMGILALSQPFKTRLKISNRNVA